MRWRRRAQSEPNVAEIEAVLEKNVTLASHFDADTKARHLSLTAELTTRKHWEGVDDIELTNEMITTLAGNAAIPILGLSPYVYRHVKWIVVYPSTTTSRGLRQGPAAGVVDDHPVGIVGQAAANSGPVTISWDAALADSLAPQRGRNVVIHEFAHKIDMSDGYADGSPPLRGTAAEHWNDVLHDEYDRAKARRSDIALRPYAWTNRAEFFAVATEAFFCRPDNLSVAKPALFGALADFYQQDPTAR